MIPGLQISGLLVSICGASCALLAYAVQGSVLAGVLWVTAALISCHGYGVVVERIARRRVSMGLTIVAGLAVMLLGSLPISACHLLTVRVQAGVVIAGFMLCGLERIDDPGGRRPPVWVTLLVIAGGLALVTTGVLLPRIEVSDLMNHSFVVKKLWDTGTTGVLHHQLGLQILGESYFAIGPGVHASSLFDYAVAPFLLVLVLWSEIACREDALGLPLFFTAAIPIVLQPELTTEWSGTLWGISALFALGPAIADRRTGWHTIVLVAALASVRHEYWPMVVPFVAAAVWQPRIEQPSRRVIARALASWYVVSVVLQISLAVHPLHALGVGFLLVAAVPVALGVVAVLGTSWRSPLAASAFATVLYAVALFSGAIRVAQHEPVASFTCWFFAALAVLVTFEIASVRRAAPAIIVAIFIAELIIFPNFNGAVRGRMVDRFGRAILAAKLRASAGDVLDRSGDVHAAQELVPAGARIGFWGKSAASLDFRRNPLRDVSWPPHLTYSDDFLTPLSAKNLARVDYVIVEDIASAASEDSWGEWSSPPTAPVDALLEPGPSAGIARVFRVRR